MSLELIAVDNVSCKLRCTVNETPSEMILAPTMTFTDGTTYSVVVTCITHKSTNNFIDNSAALIDKLELTATLTLIQDEATGSASLTLSGTTQYSFDKSELGENKFLRLGDSISDTINTILPTTPPSPGPTVPISIEISDAGQTSTTAE